MRYIFLICTLLFSYIIQAQTIPQVNNIPWYEFSKKLSVGERFKIPQDTLSLPAGATVRDTTGLIALKNGTLYRLYNGSWRSVMNGIDSVNRVGDSIIFYNDGVRLAGVYAPAPTYANGTEIESGVVKLSDGSTALTEPVWLDGATNNQDITLDAFATYIRVKNEIGLGTPAGGNDSARLSTAMPFLFQEYPVSAAATPSTTMPKSVSFAVLPTITADKIINMKYWATDKAGIIMWIRNDNTSAFNWTFGGAPVEDGLGAAITTIPRGLYYYMWDGTKWIRQAGGSSGGSGTVTSIATNDGTGITGGPITSNGTLAIDTNLLKTHASHKKAIDSLPNIYKANGTLTGNRTVDIDGKTLSFSGLTGNSFFEVLTKDVSGYGSSLGLFKSSSYLQVEGNTAGNLSVITIDSSFVELAGNDSIQLEQPITSSDTSLYKPLGVKGNGTIARMTSWHGGGSSTPTLTTSADTTLTLSTSETYVFTGSTDATWTLPAIGTTGRRYFIKNRGTAVLTIQRAGINEIFSDAAVTSITLYTGDSYTLQDDGTYFIVM